MNCNGLTGHGRAYKIKVRKANKGGFYRICFDALQISVSKPNAEKLARELSKRVS